MARMKKAFENAIAALDTPAVVNSPTLLRSGPPGPVASSKKELAKMRSDELRKGLSFTRCLIWRWQAGPDLMLDVNHFIDTETLEANLGGDLYPALACSIRSPDDLEWQESGRCAGAHSGMQASCAGLSGFSGVSACVGESRRP